ncbi:MAG: response regulator transcription factor [Dehalococcoidia bacterium]|nr:response regulator transcription factor [Dehalococcoidia bacterium]
MLVADDHALLRAGLRLLIDGQPDMQTVAEASNGAQALVHAEATQPDVALLDVPMPQGGLTILRELRARAPQTQVVVLTMHAEEEYRREALRLGASGYVVKSAPSDELLMAIRAVARGEVYIDPSLTRSLLDEILPSRAAVTRDPWDDLSAREQQVISRVAQGHTNREIAEQLALNVKTVETYRARAMDKLGLTSRSQLVGYAAHRGLLDDA